MGALQDAWAIPLAKRLVDRFRSNALTFVRVLPGQYDPQTGTFSAFVSVDGGSAVDDGDDIDGGSALNPGDVIDGGSALGSTPETRIDSAGAVVKTMKDERDGVQQGNELECWIDHTTVPWPISTNDQLEYMGKRWKIVSVSPTYSSSETQVYASKVVARAE